MASWLDVQRKSNSGFPSEPVGFRDGDDVIRFKLCPDCGGRGWFFINPFATNGNNGCGGISNACQCQTCKRAMDYYNQHGELPDDLRHLVETTAAIGVTPA